VPLALTLALTLAPRLAYIRCMDNVVATLSRELGQLEAELRGDPRYVKIKQIKELLDLYKVSESANGRRQPAESRTGKRPESKATKIRAAITSLLTNKDSTHRKDILNHLTKLGLMGNEKDPMASLAAYLSAWKDLFAFDGKGNWSLKE
jgi:hypothetical protein